MKCFWQKNWGIFFSIGGEKCGIQTDFCATSWTERQKKTERCKEKRQEERKKERKTKKERKEERKKGRKKRKNETVLGIQEEVF